LQKARVVTLHELEAAVEVRLDPAPDVLEPARCAAPLLDEPAVDGFGVRFLKRSTTMNNMRLS
jgi:hypothetical protein